MEDFYYSVLNDIALRNCREDYKAEIIRMMKDSGYILKEDLDKEYVCRGRHRKMLESTGRPVTYDRVALLYTGCSAKLYRSSLVLKKILK